MQVNYFIPDEALVEIILYLTPQQLLFVSECTFTGVEIVDHNLEQVQSLLKDKEVIGRLCSSYFDGHTSRRDTFEDYLLAHDYWYLDGENVDYHWFSVRWYLTLGIKRALYLAARNAKQDIRFLTIVDKILKENHLVCSEEHLYLVCRGLVWSRELHKKYLAPLVNYWKAHGRDDKFWNKEYDIITECKNTSKYWTPHSFHPTNLLRRGNNTELLEAILESKSTALDLEQSKLALQVLDYQDFKRLTLCEMGRLEKIKLACINNDGRVLRSFQPTLEEILEAKNIKKSALVGNEEMREKFLDIVLRNSFHDDNYEEYCSYLHYKDFHDNKFHSVLLETAAVLIRNSSRIEYTSFFVCFYKLGLDKLELGSELTALFLPSLIKRFTNKVNLRFTDEVYCPEYLQFFASKYAEINKDDLLAVVAGDQTMTEWVSSL